jgi:FkbM family methyltransferase
MMQNFIQKHLADFRELKFKYFKFKYIKFKYINPIAGLLFTLTRRYYKIDKCRFKIPRNLTSISFRSRFFYDLHEIEERKLINKLIFPKDRVIELGACLGVVSCITNKILDKDNPTHVVVEANPELIPYIYENRYLNRCNFAIELCAIAEGRELDFYVDEQIVSGSAHRETQKKRSVPARTISELETKYGEFNVLILDIQGGELDLLLFEEKTLDHLRLIIVEMHETIIGRESVKECRQILRLHNFRLIAQVDTVEAWERT